MKKRNLITKQTLVLLGGVLATSGSLVSPLTIYATDSIQSELKTELVETPINDSSSVTEESNISSSEKTSDVVTIKDPVLENLVRRQLNKTTGDLLKSDLEKITSLSYTGWYGDEKISDLSGLEWAINLEELYLNENAITDLSPLANLTKLSKLKLNENQIVDLSPLSKLTNLTYIELGWNQITNLSGLETLVNLEELYLNDNQISSLSPLGGLTKLGGLILDNNQISDLSPISSLSNLYGLSLFGNQIENISSLESLVNLEYLYLDQNKITDVDCLTGLTELQVISLSGNQIMNFPFSKEVLSDLYYYNFTGQSILFTLPTSTQTLENPFISVWGEPMDLVYSGYTKLKLTDDLSTLLFGPLVSGLEFEAFFGKGTVNQEEQRDYEKSDCHSDVNQPEFRSIEKNFNETYCVKATFRFEAPPTIEATNQEVFVGDKFDVLDWAKATDNHDDVISVEVIKSTIDVNKPGTYEVTYKAVNSFGFETTKTIQVVVKEQPVKDPSLPEEDTDEVVPPVNPETPEEETPEDDKNETLPPIDSEESPKDESIEESEKDETSKEETETDKEENKKPSQRPTVEAGFSSTLGLLGAGLIGSGLVYFKKRKK